ncbi:MAG: outer membrane lipoprotein-sorting protein [Elusimicrobia bacterium]|nr:outer membrane lipoprotein-sorting protein [Elusimicrobiota bacterium]
MPKKDDREGEVKKGIGRLREELETSGARTLGEHFSKLDPVKERIRARWTAREMFIDEFEKGNKTIVELSSIVTTKLEDRIFTKAYLENLSK